MYAYLIGKVAEIEEDNLVLEVGNIGYNVKVPGSVAAQLPPVGQQVKVYTYTSVREDALQLFGFLTKDDLRMYRMLITVSGIGPKGGLSLLGAMSADEIRMEDAFSPEQGSAVQGTGVLDQARNEAVEALTALGYPASDALRAVKAVEQEDMDVEALLKAALRKL